MLHLDFNMPCNRQIFQDLNPHHVRQICYLSFIFYGPISFLLAFSLKPLHSSNEPSMVFSSSFRTFTFHVFFSLSVRELSNIQCYTEALISHSISAFPFFLFVTIFFLPLKDMQGYDNVSSNFRVKISIVSSPSVCG